MHDTREDEGEREAGFRAPFFMKGNDVGKGLDGE
jgi:hypothetical protein